MVCFLKLLAEKGYLGDLLAQEMQCLSIVHPLSSVVRPSPSKKSRGGGQGGLRRAPTLGAPTPLSHTTGHSAMDPRLVYRAHFKSTESEADSGKK